MGRGMQIIYYNGFRQPMVAHKHEKTLKDGKTKPIPWVAETQLVVTEG